LDLSQLALLAQQWLAPPTANRLFLLSAAFVRQLLDPRQTYFFDDADATLPSLGLARRYSAAETYYPASNTEREALGDAFSAQRLINNRLESTVFWTTPDGGGTGINVGYPLEVEDYWP
jgi:hypothetical protein